MDSRMEATTLQDPFHRLPHSLQRIFCIVSFPPDNGTSIIQKVTRENNRLFGTRDASLKDKKATYVWIVSSGNVFDITDPNLHISGLARWVVFLLVSHPLNLLALWQFPSLPN
jgi:hypothetical protein